MPHSVKEQADSQDQRRRLVQCSVVEPLRRASSHGGSENRPIQPPLALPEDADAQQSPMLKAWSGEFDPKNLTINEALFLELTW